MLWSPLPSPCLCYLSPLYPFASLMFIWRSFGHYDDNDNRSPATIVLPLFRLADIAVTFPSLSRPFSFYWTAVLYLLLLSLLLLHSKSLRRSSSLASKASIQIVFFQFRIVRLFQCVLLNKINERFVNFFVGIKWVDFKEKVIFIVVEKELLWNSSRCASILSMNAERQRESRKNCNRIRPEITNFIGF